MLKYPRSYQARRRPHGVVAAGAARRYSCDTRLLLAWPSRGQSQVTEATIDEDVETTEPSSLTNLGPGHDTEQTRSDALITVAKLNYHLVNPIAILCQICSIPVEHLNSNLNFQTECEN